MGTYREQDALVAFLAREDSRVLELIAHAADNDGRRRTDAIDDARRILTALGEAETQVLHGAFSRVRLRPETQALLDDSRGARAEQLAGLERLAQRRGSRLRKLAAVELSDMVASHSERLGTLLVPVLASQLPRPVHRALSQAFMNRVQQASGDAGSAATAAGAGAGGAGAAAGAAAAGGRAAAPRRRSARE